MLSRTIARVASRAVAPRRYVATAATKAQNVADSKAKLAQAREIAEIVTPTEFPLNHNVVLRKIGSQWKLSCYSQQGKLLTEVHTKEKGLLAKKPETVPTRTYLMWILTERIIKAGLQLS